MSLIGTSINRRGFLESAACAVGAGLVAGPLASGVAAQPPSAARKRKNITSLDAHDLAAWRAGVKEMKRRSQEDPDDPTGWMFQANMHGSIVPGELFNGCQHGHWWFLPWHRMYLYYFERILIHAIQASGFPIPSDFGLPYWDYTGDAMGLTAKRTIPQSLRDRQYVPPGETAAESNPLFEVERIAARNSEMNPSPLPASAVSMTDAFAFTNFVNSASGFPSGFGGRNRTSPSFFDPNRAGQFEITPHGAVHNSVGGKMSRFDTAAQDPIFWTHHCNLDRLWNRWLAEDNRTNPDHNGPWGTQTFTFFNENGDDTTDPVHRFLEYVQGNVIDYVYDDGSESFAPPLLAVAEAPHAGSLQLHAHNGPSEGASMPTGKEVFSFPPPSFALTAEPLSVSVPIPEPQRGGIEAAAAVIESVPESTAPPKELLLVLEGIQLPGTLDGYYEVYLNPPTGAQPDFSGPHYVGNLVPFSLRGHGGHGDPETVDASVSLTLRLTDAVRRLRRINAWNSESLQVTFVPVSVEDVADSRLIRASFRAFRVIEVDPNEQAQE